MEQNEIQRIERVMEEGKIKSYAEFCRVIGYRNGQIITDLKRKNGKIPADFAKKVVEKYPQISLQWFLYGEGNMYASSIEQHNENGNNIGQQINNTTDGKDLLKLLMDKQQNINQLIENNTTLTEQISKLISMIDK